MEWRIIFDSNNVMIRVRVGCTEGGGRIIYDQKFLKCIKYDDQTAEGRECVCVCVCVCVRSVTMLHWVHITL